MIIGKNAAREWKGYGLALLLTVGMIGLLETALRVTGTAEPRRYFPELFSQTNWGDFAAGLETREYDRNGAHFRFTTNKWGLRTTGSEMENPRKFLLALGDSFTLGVVDDTGTYPYQLQCLLEPRAIQVLNAGFYGFTLEDEVSFLEEKLGLFKPDIVVLGYCRNDISDYAPFWRQSFRRHGRGNWREKQLLRNTLKQNSHLISLAKKVKVSVTGRRLKSSGQRNVAFDISREQAQAIAISPTERATYQSYYARDFEKLMALSRRHGITLLPVIFPSLGMMKDGETNPDGNFLDSLFHSHNLPYLDLEADFRGEEPESLFIVGDGHPSGRGNAIAADAIRRALHNLGYLPSASEL